MSASNRIAVHKCDHKGRYLLRYEGELLEAGPTWACVQAYFARMDVATEYVTFCKGDRMLEWFYTDRWYNIFELHDVLDDQLKGWYCNITRPARFMVQNKQISTIMSDDLALDVFVAPDGELRVLDEDEFELLNLSGYEQKMARDAVAQIQAAVAARVAPFDKVRVRS